MNIFVSNLNFKVRSEDLKNLFSQYGEVLSTKVITDKFSGKSRGFGFVEMKNDDDGQRAIAELDQKDFEGRNITVSVAKPRTEGGGNGGNGGGGRNNFRKSGGGGNDYRD
ncbi:MAG TPA: RNA-binding protein [Bacteroidia bacterium]|jgi:RNA recognition motif-containing protein|nr:RNA-binding protein [Bacteroidia bacterium]